MDTILMLIALAGFLMILIGRVLIIHEARQISTFWVLALRILPLAELMFLARYWETAKTGAFTSLIGVALIMPWGGKMLWDAQKEEQEMRARAGAGSGGLGSMNEWKVISEEEEKLAQVEYKQARLQALNGRLQGWYQAMQGRRAALGTDEAAVTAFNAEAAAYHEFLAVTREEAAAVAQLRAKK